jgi:PEP-CTERM motif
MASLFMVTPSRADLLINGNFAGGSLNGWSASGIYAVPSEQAYADCCGGYNPAPNTYAFAFGVGEQPASVILRQSFGTVVGETYMVLFRYGAFGSANGAGKVQSLLAQVDNAATTSLPVSAIGGADFSQIFTEYSFVFTASAATTTLSFRDTSTISVSVDGLLENVRVVPEPASMALLGLGMLGLGLARRHRAG